MLRLRSWLPDFLRRDPAPIVVEVQASTVMPITTAVRSRPGQALDAQMWLYAPAPEMVKPMLMHAKNVWVNTAAGKISSKAASAELYVRDKTPTNHIEDHPLLGLVGQWGRPNDYQDSFEFWENHFLHYELSGNAFWYWFNGGLGDGAPTEVHLLQPNQVKVVPGRNYGVAKYIYTTHGQEIELLPWQVTHFKKGNPYTPYYGLTALEALRVEVDSDRSMALWNAQFFGEDVAVPAGIVVVPDTVSDEELKRVSDEFNAKHGERRRTAFIKSAPGATVYHPAGIAPRDMDFTQGRMLSRQAVYEAMELPLGLMSDASTEAHARVAERQLAESIRLRHVRICRKLKVDAMPFWPRASVLFPEFEDLTIRSADWDRESKHIQAVTPFMRKNEVRTNILRLHPDPYFDQLEESENAASTNVTGSSTGSNSNPVSGGGQAGDVVG